MKMRIVLEKDDDGVFQYKGVENLYSYPRDLENLKNSYIVSLNEERYNRLKNSLSTRFIVENSEDYNSISIMVSDSLLDQLVKQCELKGYGDNTYYVIQRLLQTLMQQADGFTMEKHGGLGAFIIHYPTKVEEEAVEEKQPTEEMRDIFKRIKKRIIGQDRAIEAVLNNIHNNQNVVDTDNPKANILIKGPIGTGKTFMMKEITNEIDVPIVTCFPLFFNHYRFDDFSNILSELLRVADGDQEKAERGIIVFDELDRINEKDYIRQRALRHDLLSFLNGGRFTVNYNGRMYNMDTSQITIIGLGVFDNLEEREKGPLKEVFESFSSRVTTRKLEKEDMLNILRNSLISPTIQLQKLGKEVYQKDIIISDEVLEKMAEVASSHDNGARALTNMASLLRDSIFNSLIYGEEKEIEVTLELLDKALISEKRGASK